MTEPNVVKKLWKRLQVVVNSTVKEVCEKESMVYRRMPKHGGQNKRNKVKWLASHSDMDEGLRRSENCEANRNVRQILRRCKRVHK